MVVLDHLSETQRRAYIIADNRLSELAGWDDAVLAAELRDLVDDGLDLALVGFSDDDLERLLDDGDSQEEAEQEQEEEAIPEAPAQPVTAPGDVWLIGKHKLICGDCRDREVIRALFSGGVAHMAITSPPYASQREYDPSSGFRPIPPDEYSAWFRAVADGIESVLASDGSYFLNIKEHAQDGERHLYVKDLVIAHKREWRWRFVDEFCWRKTDNGVPGGWNNRFKNAWEPVFHFCRNQKIKFNAEAVGHESADCFDYSPDNPKSTSGSGLLGTGPRGRAADPASRDKALTTWANSSKDGRHAGIARPSNVVECKTESSQGSHSAPFPRALVEFFVKAFTDKGDVVFDPFMGSGTTIAAAEVLDRVGYGCELSPAYCDVILKRIEHLTGTEPVLAVTGETFAAVTQSRGVAQADVSDLR